MPTVQNPRNRPVLWLCGVLACTGLGLALLLHTAAAAGRRSVVQTTAAPGNSAPQVLHASLNGASEVPAVQTLASGRAVLALSGDMTSLSYRVQVNDIGGITAAHIHKGAAGENGPVIFTLFDGTGAFDPNHPIKGSLTVTPTQVTDLMSGNYYINVHTGAHPAGQIRGQIGPYQPPVDFSALLAGDREIPAVQTEGVGLGQFTLGATGTLSFSLAVRDVISITAAHIHLGGYDENGPVIFTLFDGTGSFDPSNPVSGSLSLNPENLVDLLTGYYYVNVHTAAYPSGEIRGQVSRAQVFQATLSGAKEVPPVATTATGAGILALSADASELHYRVMVDQISGITAAHIHRGAADESGPIIFTLYDGTGSFDPDHPVSGTLGLNTADVFDLISGHYYINVHTSGYPSGEIRGQIDPHSPERHLVTTLAASNEVPPVASSAGGHGLFTLDPGLNVLHYSLSVTEALSITAAHIHQATAGQNGPIVHWLYDSSGVNAPGGLFDPDHPADGCLDLSAWDLVDLLTGYLYVNVHTSGYPGGEIRGQIETARTVYLPAIAK